MSNDEIKEASVAPDHREATTHVATVPKWTWIVGGVLTAVGIVAFVVQMANGAVAGTSQYPWSFYIAMFYSCASAGAGLLIVGGIGRWMGFLSPKHTAMTYSIACASFIVASILIVVDLGFPQGILMTYTSANVASPVFFDAIALPLCIVFCIVAALFSDKSEVGVKTIAAVGMIAGLALLAIEAWLLTTCSGKDAWGVLLGAGPALIQSVTLAAAIVAIMQPKSKVWLALLAGSGIVMVASLVFDVVLNAGTGTILGMQFSAIADSPLFWVAAIAGIVGSVALFFNGSPLINRIAAACIILAVPLFKLAIFWGTQSIVAISQLESAGSYHFDIMESVVFIGSIGIGVLVYAVAALILSKKAANAKGVQA